MTAQMHMGSNCAARLSKCYNSWMLRWIQPLPVALCLSSLLVSCISSSQACLCVYSSSSTCMSVFLRVFNNTRDKLHPSPCELFLRWILLGPANCSCGLDCHSHHSKDLFHLPSLNLCLITCCIHQPGHIRGLHLQGCRSADNRISYY